MSRRKVSEYWSRGSREVEDWMDVGPHGTKHTLADCLMALQLALILERQHNPTWEEEVTFPRWLRRQAYRRLYELADRK